MQYDETAPQSNKEQAAAEGDYEVLIVDAIVRFKTGRKNRKYCVLSSSVISSCHYYRRLNVGVPRATRRG